jgi:hypothetical protein
MDLVSIMEIPIVYIIQGDSRPVGIVNWAIAYLEEAAINAVDATFVRHNLSAQHPAKAGIRPLTMHA